MNSAELANQLINRARNLQEWIVTKQLPNGFCFNGQVPFDMWIAGTTAEIKVWAVTAEEADQIVTEWIQGRIL